MYIFYCIYIVDEIHAFIHLLKKAGLCELLNVDGSRQMGVMHKMKRKPDVAKWVIGIMNDTFPH